MTNQQLNVSAVLFDLDGVLADSRIEVEEHWVTFAEWHELDAERVLSRVHGIRDDETIRHFLAGQPESEVADVIERFRRLECEDTSRTIEIPGSAALVKALPSNRIAIVTSCTRALAEARLASVGIELPSTCVFSTDVTRGKPDPEGYVLAARRLGFDASQCVVFEDAPSGLRAAIDAGAHVVGVSVTVGADAVRAVLGPEGLVVQDLSAIDVAYVPNGITLTFEELI